VTSMMKGIVNGSTSRVEGKKTNLMLTCSQRRS